MTMRQPRLNLDKHGMPRDYLTYVWLLYGKAVEDKSPRRLAFEHGEREEGDPGAIGTEWVRG